MPHMLFRRSHTLNTYPWDMSPYSQNPEAASETEVRSRIRLIPNYVDIFAKFQHRPCLRCNDVELYHNSPDPLSRAKSQPEHWCLRQFQTCWQFCPEGSSQFIHHHGFLSIRGYETQGRASTLYSNIRSLARAIVNSSHLSAVSFNGGHPTVPFARVDLDSFQFASRCDDYYHSAHPVQDPVDKRQCLVNGRLSCAYHFYCTCSPMPGSVYCCFHHIAIARYFLSLPELDNDKIKAQISFTARKFRQFTPCHNVDNQPTVMLQKPSSKSGIEAVRLVHSLYQSKTIWVIDVEFHQPRGYKPVPFCIAVFDAKTDKITLRTTVDYES
jgi:hypothetical protein